MSVEDAVKLVVSAGIVTPKNLKVIKKNKFYFNQILRISQQYLFQINLKGF